RHADLAQPGAEDALAGDEGGAPRRAALLAVRVREPHPFVGDPVDVGRSVAHQPVAVAAEVGDPDVVAPDHENVRLLGRHARSPFVDWRPPGARRVAPRECGMHHPAWAISREAEYDGIAA